MSFSKFFGLGLLLALLTGGLTIIFDKYLGIVDPWNNYVLWFLIIIVTTGVVRRLGVISFLEAVLVSGVWLFFRMLFDVLITAPILGVGMYGKAQVWVSYVIIILSIFFLHKKLHVHNRKQMHGHH
jgi:hypothetical protein